MNYIVKYGEEIDKQLVSDLENTLKIKFPKEYMDFIVLNNGGYIKPNNFKMGDKIGSINNFHNVKDHYEFSDERFPEGFVTIGCDAGSNQICFDFRENSDTKNGIYFWIYELEKFVFVASSFNEFLGMLFEHDE